MRRIGMERTGRVLLSIASLVCGPTGGRAADDPPLAIARDGFFYVGGKSVALNGRPYMSGQMYVEFRVPAKQTHPFPIVMVHGGTMSGTNFTGTPDGREGWAQFFVRRGYPVYVVASHERSLAGASRYACPMKCEGDKSYAAEGKCPVCGTTVNRILGKAAAS